MAQPNSARGFISLRGFALAFLLAFCCYDYASSSDVSIDEANGESKILPQPFPDRASMNAFEIYFDRESIKPFVDKIDLNSGIPMSSGSGEGFICLSQKQDNPDEGEAKQSGEGEESLDNSRDAIHNEDSLPSAMFEELNGACFEKRMGFWTYKVCPFQKVEQLHYEGKRSTQSFDLGTYDEESSNETTQIFNQGTDGRKSVVKFICSENSETTVSMVSEATMHTYTIILSSYLACSSTADVQLRKLLSPLEGHCLQRMDGWWTYEFCYRKYARQFHKGKNNKEEAEFKLGYFDAVANEKLEQEGQALSKTVPEGKPVFNEIYTKGTECDLTGQHRSTKVVYTCPSSSSGFVDLAKVEESSTCGYIFHVMVPALCLHPFFEESSHVANSLPLSTTYCVPEEVYRELAVN